MLLRHARYLVAIADQAISRAARRCMSRSLGLSQQIRQLEDTLPALHSFWRAFDANAYVLLVHHEIAFAGLCYDVGRQALDGCVR